MLKYAAVSVTIVTLGLTLAMLPATGATATLRASTEGSAPSSPLCKQLRSLTPSISKDSAGVERASKSRDWPVEKAAYLSGLKIQVEEFKTVLQGPSATPKDVRLDAPKAIKAANSLMSALKESKSSLQFNSPATSVALILYNDAQKPVLQYFGSQCGG
jgi:hypothetical protein